MTQRTVKLVWNLVREKPGYLVGQRTLYDAQTLDLIGDVNEEYLRVLIYETTVTEKWTRQFRTRPLYLNEDDGFTILDSQPLRLVHGSSGSPINSLFEIKLPDLGQEGFVELPLPEFDSVAKDLIESLRGTIRSLQNSEPIAEQLGLPYVESRPRRIPIEVMLRYRDAPSENVVPPKIIGVLNQLLSEREGAFDQHWRLGE